MSQTPSQTVCSSATDPQTVVVTANVQKYALKKKKVLNAEETELFELSQAAGITLDQEVFKIMVDLLKMNVAPQAVFQTLKSMCASQRAAEGGALDASSSSHTTSAPSAPAAAPTESRGFIGLCKELQTSCGSAPGVGPKGTHQAQRQSCGVRPSGLTSTQQTVD
ncbi:mitotic-spindle organizing protein 2 isoform X4 [Gouania willdenowi]|uniref:mitotic-spindle organizing protein 2 isoform X4 n=1 Tax=Gouania willdenowi TaxID=441366 RepID=UPI001055FC33|nr:mitotic-spindle organizing protein 2-like isoform X4 [Gouania willdenowi]